MPNSVDFGAWQEAIARAEAAERRIAELETALRWIANTNGAQGVLAVNVARRALKGAA